MRAVLPGKRPRASAYVSSNVMGHVVILECARRLEKPEHFVQARSSSVDGVNTSLPFAETDVEVGCVYHVGLGDCNSFRT